MSKESFQTRTEFERVGSRQEKSAIGEVCAFVSENRRWWMLPIFMVLGALAVLAVLSTTAAAPFIYTLF